MIDAYRDESTPFERRWDASVSLELERQIGLNWCWAAVAKGIVDHYGGPIQQQCEYATTFLQQSETCCGGNELEPRCDVPYDVDTVLVHYDMYASPPYHRPVKLTTLRRELERDRPVVALIEFPASVHAVAITAVDVVNRRIGFCDPGYGAMRLELDADVFERAYDRSGRWFYTIFTRPPADAAPAPTVSLLRERMPGDDSGMSWLPHRRIAPLEVDVYRADAAQLAQGTGLRTADLVERADFHLDAYAGDFSTRIDRELTALREDVEARLARGFELRLLRCFALKLDALWFTNPADPAHRTDHYIAIPPVPYYLEPGREYGVAELRDILVEPARICRPAVEITNRFMERLARESAFHVDDPTI